MLRFKRPDKVFYFASTSIGNLLSRLLCFKLEQYCFRGINLKTEEGDSRWLSVFFFDVETVQNQIRNTDEYKEAMGYIDREYSKSALLKLALLKQTLHTDILREDWKLQCGITRVYAVLEKEKQVGSSEHIFFQTTQPWIKEIEKFFKGKTKIVSIPDIRGDVTRWLRKQERVKLFIKLILYYWMILKYRLRHKWNPCSN